jgi:RNA-binding protein 39
LRLLHTRQLTCLSFTRARLRQERREAELRARELEELDRDVRTVFAYNVSTKADERDLFEFFSGAGTVLDVRIIYDLSLIHI